MSTFGSPGGQVKAGRPTPPERGSFPLDHDGECKHIISRYLSCIRSHRGTNDAACRELSKQYLTCRMDRNLMAPDSFKNLGFGDDADGPAQAPTPTPATATPSQQQPRSQTDDKPRAS
ncbi:hypothetical protein P171DRAFT_224037 [Karstenula rhodostoma CBS 690.94]|uniref:CHCH domain-containing protein n=1 Tax=Karstenula rhodostoma CBS 690.94 TaxID=1392251 RepID=A0A9P4PQ94_9PLEO|nr:hypothetical protein P171DRAFT_224037 [Karstenula rhodostoma CBS 690.94]